ncbi:MAG: UDP-N-acetylglucosamine pyrophosphorylase [Desulfobacterota bacterium]|nr:UDP-N-acetylglucosamine pyrophosphorylase [Thermodesulfobacteriota bacterium]
MGYQLTPDPKIDQLFKKGVKLPSPFTIDIGEEVDIDRISGKGVRIYPGCRIYGEKTVISSGVQLGAEGPVTLENCQLGPGVELKGGYFKNSVFLEKSSMGSGAHVREACLLEEQASGAHCVGLKHTILFPFVTLGSLINFCDCLMAGGTSRKDHSEVGSSFIHFNFTPDGDKATPSLIGDVPRGVMLNKPPIFLGGQGGLVGPLWVNFGNVTAAGAILRKDIEMENCLIVGRRHSPKILHRIPKAYPNLSKIVENNVRYIGNLIALEQWYRHVRKLFFREQEYGTLIWEAVLDNLQRAKKERFQRLKEMANKVAEAIDLTAPKGPEHQKAKQEFFEKGKDLEGLLDAEATHRAGEEERDTFLDGLLKQKREHGDHYLKVIQGLPTKISSVGTAWLDAIVLNTCLKAKRGLPALRLFKGIGET